MLALRQNPVWIFFDETNIFYVEEDGEVFCYDFALKEKHTFEKRRCFTRLARKEVPISVIKSFPHLYEISQMQLSLLTVAFILEYIKQLGI